MLAQTYPESTLSDLLIPRESWRPYPTANDRDGWEGLRESLRHAHIARGERGLDCEWKPVLAVRFLDYVRDGNRSRFESVHFAKRNMLTDLVLAECIEGKGRFLDDILNGVWAICEESFWGVAAHVGAQRAGSGLADIEEPIVDLFAAETSALLSWTSYLLGARLDGISRLINRRIELEIRRRILTPLLEREDFGWMGFRGQRVNNWNPWICSNWLTSALLTEKDEERRRQHVAKAMRALDNFIDPYPKDGGCDEGPGYWGVAGAAMYHCLELLHQATGGRVDVFHEPLIAEIGRFIYRVQIADRYFVNFADAAAIVSPSPVAVYCYGKRIGDERMASLGAWAARDQNLAERGFGDNLGKRLLGLFSAEEMLNTQPACPLPRDAWMGEIEVMIARDTEGSKDGFFVAAKGGHNAESHNHNDIGNAVVYADGKPVLVDAGVETYSAKTFSGRRYEIWTMQSAYHNVPTVNGIQQAPGREYAAKDVRYSSDERAAEVSMDISGAYPPEAGIRRWTRTMRLERGRGVSITDVYDLSAPAKALTLNLLTACVVEPAGDGRLKLKPRELAVGQMSGVAAITYDPAVLEPTVEEVPITDGRLAGIWGESLARIVFRAIGSEPKGSWSVGILTSH